MKKSELKQIIRELISETTDSFSPQEIEYFENNGWKKTFGNEYYLKGGYADGVSITKVGENQYEVSYSSEYSSDVDVTSYSSFKEAIEAA